MIVSIPGIITIAFKMRIAFFLPYAIRSLAIKDPTAAPTIVDVLIIETYKDYSDIVQPNLAIKVPIMGLKPQAR